MKKHHLTLTDSDHCSLTNLLAKGQLPARVARRATALLHLHQGATLQTVSQLLNVAPPTVAAWRDHYRAHGLAALHDAPRAGRPVVIDGVQRAKLTALACSTPPPGYARWSLRLLADKAVELGFCPAISHHAVKTVLKKMPSSRI